MDPFLDMRGRCEPHGRLRESLCHILTMRSSEMPNINILMLTTSSRVHSESLGLVLMSMSYTALIVPALLRPLLSPSQLEPNHCRRCAQTNHCGRVIRNTASTRDGREVRCGGPASGRGSVCPLDHQRSCGHQVSHALPQTKNLST
jgi:hypothetical protein